MINDSIKGMFMSVTTVLIVKHSGTGDTFKRIGILDRWPNSCGYRDRTRFFKYAKKTKFTL
ncbi:hypothetical protein F4819DRAFT_466501, partial [Hypoxylon fuscum]